MDDKKKKLIYSYMDEGLNCSQTVMKYFLDDLDIDEETAMKISQPFEMGHYQGGLCGSLSSGLMVLGLKFGGRDDDSKGKVVELSYKLQERFKKIMKCSDCKDLLGINVNEGSNLDKAFQEGKIETICPKSIFAVIDIIEDILSKQK